MMIKYCLAPLFLLSLLICDWLGPSAVWIFFFSFSAFVIIGDTLFGNDRVQFQNGENKLNPILYFILPILFVKLFNITLLGVNDSQSIIAKILSAWFILLLLWKYRTIMEEKLQDWDTRFVSQDELKLIGKLEK